MHRKFLRFLPLLIAAVAVMVMPAVAQATPHWYKNHLKLPEEVYHNEGVNGEETQGVPIISWGTLVLETKTVGVITCENEFGGDIYNPKATGAPAGEAKIDAYNVYDCSNELCETTFKSKQELLPEGLEKFGEWEAKLTEAVAGKPKLKTGNNTLNSPTQIKFLIKCPPAGVGEINTKSKGELEPSLENGSLIGAAPSKVKFEGITSGELEIANVKEGKVVGELKTMGYEGGEIITAAP